MALYLNYSDAGAGPSGVGLARAKMFDALVRALQTDGYVRDQPSISPPTASAGSASYPQRGRWRRTRGSSRWTLSAGQEVLEHREAWGACRRGHPARTGRL